MNFSAIADAAKGVLDNAAEYGERLKDHTPASLTDATWAREVEDKNDWEWVDDSNDYFGKTGEQTFVVKNGNDYNAVTTNVNPRKITPTVRAGSYEEPTPPTEWAGNPNKAGSPSDPLSNYIPWSAELPKNPGEAVVMRIDDLFAALGSSGNTKNDSTTHYVSNPGWATSDYFVYADGDHASGNNLIIKNQTRGIINNFPEIGYNLRNSGGDLSVFGGALECVTYHNFGYVMGWDQSFSIYGGTSNYYDGWGVPNSATTYVDGSTLVTIVRRPAPHFSIITLQQLYNALGTTKMSQTANRKEITPGYGTSHYYVYAINDTSGTDDSSVSTYDNLVAVGEDWYKKCMKPTASGQHFGAGDGVGGGHTLFGGPLQSIGRDSNGTYKFACYYSDAGDKNDSSESNYWGNRSSGNTYVALVWM